MERNDQPDDKPEPEVEVYFVDGRSRLDTIPEAGFAVFTAVTLSLWMGALYLFILRAEFQLKLDKSDLGIASSAAATLASIALAFLALLHQLTKREKLLKLCGGLLTFFFLVSTLLIVLTVITYEENLGEIKPHIQLWFFSSSVLVIPYLAKRFIANTWSRLRYVLYLLPFFIPLPLVAAISEGKLFTSAVLFLLLGVIGLPVLTAVFIYYSLKRQENESAEELYLRASADRWRRVLEKESHYQELKGRVLKFFRDRRNRDFIKTDHARRQGEDSLFLTKEYISKQSVFINESAASAGRVIDELADANILHENHGRYYLAPSDQEIEELVKQVKSQAVVILRGKNERTTNPKELNITRELADRLKYPAVTAEKFVLPRIKDTLDENFSPSPSSYYFTLYVNNDPKGKEVLSRLLSLWEDLSEKEFGSLISGILRPTERINIRDLLPPPADRDPVRLTGDRLAELSPEVSSIFAAEVFPPGTDAWDEDDVKNFFSELRKIKSREQ